MNALSYFNRLKNVRSDVMYLSLKHNIPSWAQKRIEKILDEVDQLLERLRWHLIETQPHSILKFYGVEAKQDDRSRSKRRANS